MHKLESDWTFYYYKQEENKDYQLCINKIGKFSTCEDFWAYYSHIQKPDQLQSVSLQIFRNDSRAVWEDEENQNGGSFLIIVNKTLVNLVWEILVLNLIGEQFPSDVSGIVVAQKKKDYNIQIWQKTNDLSLRLQIATVLMKVLNLPVGSELEYISNQYKMNRKVKNFEQYIIRKEEGKEDLVPVLTKKISK